MILPPLPVGLLFLAGVEGVFLPEVSRLELSVLELFLLSVLELLLFVYLLLFVALLACLFAVLPAGVLIFVVLLWLFTDTFTFASPGLALPPLFDGGGLVLRGLEPPLLGLPPPWLCL